MADEDHSDKAAAPTIDGQLTVGELREELADVPDWAGVNVAAGGGVGFAKSVSFTADGLTISER
jgi:hypothetical protein